MAIVNPTPLSTLPTPPTVKDPATFDARADAHVLAVTAMVPQANAANAITYQNAVESATSATAAADSATAANASALSAAGSATAPKWVSGTNYAVGTMVWSPANNQNYRCIVAISPSTVDPSSASANWGSAFSGVATLVGTETLTNKTLSGASNTFSNIPLAALAATVDITRGGTGATTAAAARTSLGAQAELGFVAGTRMPFAQAAAPTGWTQDATDNAINRMLRVVATAGGGIGGSHSPILNNVVASHTHGFTTGNMSADHSHAITDPGHSHVSGVPFDNSVYGTAATAAVNGKTGVQAYSTSPVTSSVTTGITTAGTSVNHTHSGSTDNGSSQTSWTPRYIDMIICAKQ